MTGQAEVATAVRAMRQGAVDYLQKPIGAADLYEAVERALAEDSNNRRAYDQRESLVARFAQVKTPELQVLELLLQGHANKSIAAALGVSRRTVEDRRAKLMQKLQAETLAELIRVAIEAEGQSIHAQRSLESSPRHASCGPHSEGRIVAAKRGSTV